MKAKLSKGDRPSKKMSKINKKSFKEKKAEGSKKSLGKNLKKVKRIETDVSLEKKLQEEVQSFLSNPQFEKSNMEKKLSKKHTNDDVASNIENHKYLNQDKYASKLLKKNKLKQNNLNKLETRKKKRQQLVENNFNGNGDSKSPIKQHIRFNIPETSSKSVHENKKQHVRFDTTETSSKCFAKTSNGKKKLKETDEERQARIERKKQRKREKLLRKLEKKLKNKSSNSLENVSDEMKQQRKENKKNQNRSKKLRKKELLLKKLLKEQKNSKSKSDCNANTDKRKPSIETLMSQISKLKLASHKGNKRSSSSSRNNEQDDVDTVARQMKKIKLENSEHEKKKKKKISKENNDLDINAGSVENKENKMKKKSKKLNENNEPYKRREKNGQRETTENDGKKRVGMDILEDEGKKRSLKKAKNSSTANNEQDDIDIVAKQMKKIKLENCELGKKKKKSKRDKNTESNNNEAFPNVLESQGEGGHKKEKFFNSKHTPLREKLMNKLKAARFRYLNEQLYTSKSEESKDFFVKDPASFEVYHEGFKKQVTQWPINPVDIIIKSIQERESSGRLVIADLGCGEAKLAAELSEQHKVHSLDLVALNDRVVPCDMSHTPLKTGSVDVVVFCLSLMGTDLAACVKEANRILRLGGEMKIAEVESRFHDVQDFIKDVQKFGFEKKMLNMDYSIFCFLDFKKVSNLSKTKKKKLPDISLKPCLYKKR